MKKAQATKLLDGVLFSFGHNISVLTFELGLASTQFKEAYQRLQQHFKKVSQLPDNDVWKARYDKVFMFSSAIGSDVSGEFVVRFPLGRKDIKLNEKKDALLDNLNRQYCWILVTAFEEYERAMKETYATMGYLDNAFWQCDDFGSASPSSISKLKLEWYKDRVRDRSNHKFRNNANYAIAQFRKSFAEVGVAEAKVLPAGKMSLYSNVIYHQSLETLSLGKTCQLAEKLRHQVVHEQGVVSDVSWLADAIGVKGKKKLTILNDYLKATQKMNCVWLVNDKEGFLDYKFLQLRIDHLLGCLCAHACSINKWCLDHFGKNAHWKR